MDEKQAILRLKQDDPWLILNIQGADDTYLPVLVEPFTCQALRLQGFNEMVDGWSP
jgi:hypothetical protein